MSRFRQVQHQLASMTGVYRPCRWTRPVRSPVILHGTNLTISIYHGDRNEVGDAIKKSGIDRSQFFVTTKVIGPPESLDPEETYQSLVKAVEKFGLGNNDVLLWFVKSVLALILHVILTDYVDLFLVHTPKMAAGAKARKVVWQALERCQSIHAK